MLGGYRFRLHPDREQERILLRGIGCQRLIYNAKVQEDRYYRKFQRRLVALAGMSVPVDQGYSRFITERTAFLREVPSQVLRNGAALWRQPYARFFAGLGGRPKYQTKAGRLAVWLTSERFEFVPDVDPSKDGVVHHRLRIGTAKFPVGEVSYRAHRPHGIPASIHICVEGGRWFVSFAAEDPAVPGGRPENAAGRIAEDLRHLSEGQLLERTLGADRGVAKPLMTSDGRVFDLSAVQRERIEKSRRRRKTWQRRAARRGKGSRNQQKAYRRAGRYARYEADVRQDYAHKASHALVVDDRYDLYAFEDLRIGHMTRKPKAPGAAVGEPGNSGGDPGNPRLKPHGLGGGRVHEDAGGFGGRPSHPGGASQVPAWQPGQPCARPRGRVSLRGRFDKGMAEAFRQIGGFPRSGDVLRPAFPQG